MKATCSSQRPRRAGKRQPRQRGFLLLEVLIAILILSFGLLGLVGLQANVVGNSITAEDRTQASLLANELVSTMWAQGTTSPQNGVIAAWQTKVSTSLAEGVGNVSPPDATRNNLVTITIQWRIHTNHGTGTNTLNQYVTQVAM
jgi:type IV pilus assembly protein PilV